MTVITAKKSDLVQELLCLNSKPYTLKGREPFVGLYDLLENDRLLMMGRQIGKSTYIASTSLIDSGAINFFHTLYVSPRQDQTSEFSNAKLSPFINFSPNFKALYLDRDSVQNVNLKTFRNGSSIILKHAFHTADAVRGVSADHVTIDEVQDIIMGNVPVIEECLSGSPYQWRTYAGTPKTINNTLAQLWFRSTQNEWILKCPHCNTWNILGMENIGPESLICKKCGKELPKDAQGQWVAKKAIDNKQIFMAGFRVPQLISPTVKWHKIIEKMQTYSRTKFLNEVMALPSDTSTNPLSESDLKGVCTDQPLILSRTPDYYDTHLFIGIDWGQGEESMTAKKGGAPTGFTVLSLGCYDWAGQFRLLGMKKFSGKESDPIYQIDYISNLIQATGATAVGVDWGAGFLHNAQLKERTDPGRIIEWQATDSLRVPAKWIPEASRMVFNRTTCMTDRFVEIKNRKVSFFNWKDFKEFSPDFLTICIEYRGEGGSSMYYSHVLPDDCFHSYMLCKMTADHILNSNVS